MEIKSDDWLSGIFGYPVFQVYADVHENVEDQLHDHIASQSKALYWAKIPTDAVMIGRQLLAQGFYVVDVNATVERRANIEDRFCDARGIEVHAYAPQYESVLDVARSCFRRSRFHLDPNIPNDMADTVKVEWVRNYTRGLRGDKLFVVAKGEHVIGFLAALVYERDGMMVANGDLLGVLEPFQRLGVGRILLEAFVREYKKRCDFLQGGIQMSNISSLRLSDRMGFFVSRAQQILHLHV